MSGGLGLFDCDNDGGTKAIERPSAVASQILDGVLQIDPGNMSLGRSGLKWRLSPATI